MGSGSEPVLASPSLPSLQAPTPPRAIPHARDALARQCSKVRRGSICRHAWMCDEAVPPRLLTLAWARGVGCITPGHAQAWFASAFLGEQNALQFQSMDALMPST